MGYEAMPVATIELLRDSNHSLLLPLVYCYLLLQATWEEQLLKNIERHESIMDLRNEFDAHVGGIVRHEGKDEDRRRRAARPAPVTEGFCGSHRRRDLVILQNAHCCPSLSTLLRWCLAGNPVLPRGDPTEPPPLCNSWVIEYSKYLLRVSEHSTDFRGKDRTDTVTPDCHVSVLLDRDGGDVYYGRVIGLYKVQLLGDPVRFKDVVLLRMYTAAGNARDDFTGLHRVRLEPAAALKYRVLDCDQMLKLEHLVPVMTPGAAAGVFHVNKYAFL